MDNKGLMNGLIRSLGKDSLAYIPGKIIPALVGFIGLSIYTRVYTPEEYGNYALVIGTVSMLSIFSYIWLCNTSLRFYASYRNNNELERFFSTTLIILIACIVLTLIGTLVMVELSLISGVVTTFILIIAGLLISSSFTETLIMILRTDRQARYISFFRSFSAIANILITLSLIFIFHAGIISILLGQFTGDALISLMIFFRFKFSRLFGLKYFSISAFKEFCSYGLPYIIVAMSAWILAVSNRFIIEYFKGDYDVGIYSAASQLGTYPIDMISAMLVMAAFPIIINNWEKNGDESTKELISTVVRYYMIITLPVFFGLFMLSQDFSLFLGAKYAVGSAIIPWVSLASVFTGINNYMDMGLQLKKKTIYISGIMIFTAVASIGLNVVLISMYGYYGSSISSALSQMIFLVLTWIVSWRYLAWRFPLGAFIKTIGASLAMCLVIWAMKYTIFANESLLKLVALVIIGGLTYMIAIYLSGELREEIGIVKEIASAGAGKIKISIHK